MRLSEMKQKEVINIKDCSRLGFWGTWILISAQEE